MKEPVMRSGTDPFAVNFNEQPALIVFQNGEGRDVRAPLIRVTRHSAVFELYDAEVVLRTSEVLLDLRILIDDQQVYSGRAVISCLVNTGVAVLCEVTLEEPSFNLRSLWSSSDLADSPHGFEQFFGRWGKTYRVHPEFKVAVADLQTFFMDLRLWMEQAEIGVGPPSDHERQQQERVLLSELEASVLATVEPLLEKFETIASKVPDETVAAHRAYAKRQLHPLVLCSPFLNRSFYKPLGYAGDYEMVNMMAHDPFKGSSLFAKMVNRIFLNTPPVVAHQSRINYLTQKLLDEVKRIAAQDQVASIYSLGCGPAVEIQDFLIHSDLSSRCRFTLVDMNDETLQHAATTLNDIGAQHDRNVQFEFVKKTASRILKDTGRSAKNGSTYDLIYCAGLLDYLGDRPSKQLLNHLYGTTAPGGLLIATNVDSSNPSRGWMEHVLDWYLVYRDTKRLGALAPDGIDPADWSVSGIGSGVNISLEIRKS